MTTSVVSVRVMCPKCRISYKHHYLPERALPELNGIGYGNFDDCVVTSCPFCDHQISVVVQLKPD